MWSKGIAARSPVYKALHRQRREVLLVATDDGRLAGLILRGTTRLGYGRRW